MFDRRRVLAALAALFLPVSRAPAAPVAAVSGVRLVDGWIVTERDLAAVNRLAR